jgi:geranylgeranyl diphosphate synthase type I
MTRMTSITTAGDRSATATFAAFERQLAELRQRIDAALGAFLDAKADAARYRRPGTAELVGAVSRLVSSGGKRLRPALVLATYRAAGGRHDDAVLPLALSTELLHSYLLIHDDIMDRADRRRGEPTAHEAFRAHHADGDWHGDGAHFGASAAILAGDLAATWATELARLGPKAEGDPGAVAAAFTAMCEEVIGGQYLEMTLPLAFGVSDDPTADDLLEVLRLKSGRYSVERPMELGALAAGARPALWDPLSVAGESLGEAFQLQDDVLGLFGEPETTGKSVGSDLAEGKVTFLIHHALAEGSQASDDDRRWLRSALGRADLAPQDVARAQEILSASGALDAVRTMIVDRLDTARAALAAAPLADDDRAFFEGLAQYLAGRDL